MNYRLIVAVQIVFFVSGIPALLYQIVWQRSLFAIYGTNIESVTAVVAAFLLGLGIGSLAGGAASARWPERLLPMFAVVELGIGAYGVLSLNIFEWVGSLTAGVGVTGVGLLSFAMIVVPTMLMGATLPILVAYLVRVNGRVGFSIGGLYFANTLGAACACIAAATWTMKTLGLSGSVQAAAALNCLVGLSMLGIWTLGRSGSGGAQAPIPEPHQSAGRRDAILPLGAAMIFASATGFLSLSFEILWIRAYTLAAYGVAMAFPLVLGFFLFGVALGATLGRHISATHERGRLDARGALFVLTLLASLFAYVVVPGTAQIVQHTTLMAALPLVTIGAALWGAALPLLGQLSIRPDEKAGLHLAWVYAANIGGTVLGSLLTGFILMDLMGLRDLSLILAVAGLALSILMLRAWGARAARTTAYCAICFVLAGIMFWGSPRLYHRVFDLLHFKAKADQLRIAELIENKSGVIAVGENGAVYGGGVYDGVFSTDLVNDRNGIFRPFALSAFHPKPAHALMIGLASGSWAQVIAHHPDVESLTIVEINPGYLRLIEDRPEVQSLLANPKVRIILDDGRRWLRGRDGTKFDAVIMNTTFSWRAFTSNLLSREFLALVRSHLKKDGIFFYNTTGSPTAQRTAAETFPYVYRFSGFVFVSDAPMRIDTQRWRRILAAYQIDGRPVLDLNDHEAQRHLDSVAEIFRRIDDPSVDPWISIETRESILKRTTGATIITDDNMASEWGRY